LWKERAECVGGEREGRGSGVNEGREIEWSARERECAKTRAERK